MISEVLRPTAAPLAAIPPFFAPRRGFDRMSTTPPTSREVLDRLDARHDELIAKLDELNTQIEAALAEFAHSREQAGVNAEVRAAA